MVDPSFLFDGFPTIDAHLSPDVKIESRAGGVLLRVLSRHPDWPMRFAFNPEWVLSSQVRKGENNVV